jgi:hypothetical protein
MLLVKPDFAFVEPSDLHLNGVELALSTFTAVGGLGYRRRQSLDLVTASLKPRGGGIDLTGQSGQALASIGCGTLKLSDATLFGSCCLLSGRTRDLCFGQCLAGGLDLTSEFELLGAQ